MPATLSTIRSDPYLKLITLFPLRPIRTRRAHQRAMKMLRGLAGKRGSAVLDYKAVLVSLIADFERSRNLRLDTSKVTPPQIVRHLLEDKGMSISKLADVLDLSQSSLSDMLNGRRDWSKQAMIRIADYFGLRPEIFLRGKVRGSL